MNKSMLMGLVGGIAIATAGGVAGYAFLSQPAAVSPSGSAAIDEPVVEQESAVAARAAAPAPVPSAATASTVRQPAPAPARQAATAPARQSAPAPQPVAAAAPQERCWDEEVTVQADPRDDKAIAGTAAGAVIGGAIAKKLGDDNDLLTAAGAAAGAFAGRRAQRQVQENKTTTVTERRCEPL